VVSYELGKFIGRFTVLRLGQLTGNNNDSTVLFDFDTGYFQVGSTRCPDDPFEVCLPKRGSTACHRSIAILTVLGGIYAPIIVFVMPNDQLSAKNSYEVVARLAVRFVATLYRLAS
jgi:hypothetical protein